MTLTLERPPNNDEHTVPISTVSGGILSLAVGSYRGHEIEIGRDSLNLGQLPMDLKPNSPVCTTGQGRGGEHRESVGMIAHCVGEHQRGGWKGPRAGEPRRSRTGRHLDGIGKHWVDSYMNPRVRRKSSKKNEKKKMGEEEGPGGA